MGRFLGWYLIVTGVAAVCAVLFPSLILVGLFFLILPGAMLVAAPTAFVYGLAFSAGWFPTRAWTDSPVAGFVAGLSIMAAVAVVVPGLREDVTGVEVVQGREGDRRPATPVRLGGHVRIEVSRSTLFGQWQGHKHYDCNTICAAALHTPGVETVTVADLGDRAERGDGSEPSWTATFRLEDRAFCDGTTEDDPRDLEYGRSLGRSVALDTGELRRGWEFAKAKGSCTVRVTDGASPPGKPDWVLRFIDPDRRRTGSTVSTRLSLDGPEGLVLQRTEGRAFRPGPVFFMGFDTEPPRAGGGFVFGGTYDRVGEIDPVAILARETDLGVTAAASTAKPPTCDDLRRWVSRALDDPALPANAGPLELIPDLILSPDPGPRREAGRDATRDGGPDPGMPACSVARPGDMALFTRILGDPRPLHLHSFDYLLKMFGAGAVALRTPIVARLLRMGAGDGGSADMQWLDKALQNMPPGTFAVPTSGEERILADRRLRGLLPGLILRLGDGGPAAGPVLARIVAERWPSRESFYDRSGDAALVTLCKLGTSVGSELPTLVRAAPYGFDPGDHFRNIWPYTLVHVGMAREAVMSLLHLSADDQRDLDVRLNASGEWSQCYMTGSDGL